MPSPIDDIENAKAQHDMGVMAFRIFQGARAEGATKFEAFMVMVAWFRGLIGSNADKHEEKNDE